VEVEEAVSTDGIYFFVFPKFLAKNRKRLLTVDFLGQRLFLMRRRRILRGRDRDRWSIEEGF
jgi:hypothetical protein